ncbi:aromatic ring-hydroxylating dioxygenase subunit alpha [Craterilacuibacter sp. RT1T]|uniref:aromatic ring-hydroxylating oxygenase subunit alpha n=1 Tax=Craterilacuibacter sp. RT1T TaxID=2942211 RepID=UPI0020BDF4F3|nr:aromatic ring-hydroxylating dioxygenase subunit alpha [Craterilacuibacter sp. RT1T]MCL6263624.1 aromatic ring-hydroxylating dioxygenase subunit alpha [Craterilacuibacter sp. RT1T]
MQPIPSFTLSQDFGRNHDNAYTLPANYYTSEAVFEYEKEHIFAHAWLCLCHTSELAEINAYVTRRIVGENLVALRDREGTLRAFYNVCPHRGHELLKGSGVARNTISCPYHAWTFKLDGELAFARNCENVEHFNKADYGLTPLRVAEYAGFVFVNMDMDAPPIEQALAGLDAHLKSVCPNVERLQVASRTITDTPANWKVIVDNYMECYHCAPAHPGFSSSVDTRGYTHTFHGNWTLQHGPGQSSERGYSFDTQVRNRAFSGYWVWPCVMFNVVPGDDTMTVIYEYPVSAGLTVQYYEVLMKSKDVTPEQRDFITWATQTFRPEDLSLVESVQRGLQSRGYRGQGRIMVDAERSGISEHGIAYFHRKVADYYEQQAGKSDERA